MDEKEARALLAILDRLEKLLPDPVENSTSWQEINELVAQLRRRLPDGQARDLAAKMLYVVSEIVRAQGLGKEEQARRQLREQAGRLRGELTAILGSASRKG